MDMEKVAVLLPLYKNDNPVWFKQSLDSVLGQTGCTPHVYVGVDGSIPDSLDNVLDTYNSDSLSIIRFETNRGLACVLNDLLKISTNDGYYFFARMDADDISKTNRFKKQIDFLIRNPAIDVVGCDIEEIDEGSNPNGKIIKYPKSNTDCFRHFRYRDPLAHPAVMFRSTYFQKVPGYRPEYRKNQDTMLWFDGFCNGCKFANIDEVLLSFRVTNDFYSRRAGLKRAKQMLCDRFKINKALNYDLSAYLFALAMFGMTISPSWIKKYLYKIRR